MAHRDPQHRGARESAANPVPMAAWGLIVAGESGAGFIPLFIGLVVAGAVLGPCELLHLYRKLVTA